MKILILGSGMYVTGKGTSSTGTILSAVIQSSLTQKISEIVIVSKSESSRNTVEQSVDATNNLLGTELKVSFYATESREPLWLDEYLLASNFDAAIVSLPDHLHHEYALKCLNAKINTLVVKPLTPTVREAESLIEKAKQNQVYGAVEFHKRWDESNLYIKNSLLDGRLGEPLYFDINYSQKIQIPSVQFANWAEKTNIFQYLGVHYVDLIYFITGKTPKKLSVYSTKKKLIKMGINTYDSIHVSSIWGDKNSSENDFYAHFNLNWIDPDETTAMSDQRISLVGTEGRIDCDQKNRGIYEVTSKNGAQSINPYFSTWISKDTSSQINGYGIKSISGFLTDVQALLNGDMSLEYLTNNRPSFSDCLVSTAFIEQVNTALKNNSNEYYSV